tara:strand:+ start:384 stop:617 length:234 start_codon:yes stop_codon:yes gene_type:complete
MDHEKFGIIATIVILAVVLSVSGIAQNVELNIENPLNYNPNGAQTKSIEQIKAENMAENLDALQKYCEALGINCSNP